MPETKTVGLDREAYERLRAEKREGETFSDVVKRITKKRRPITDFIGAWNDLPPDEVKKFDEAFQAGRKADREQAERAFKRVEGVRARR